MSTFNLLRIRELLAVFEDETGLGPVLTLWIDHPVSPLDRALAQALSERARERVMFTLQALVRWADLRGLGQEDVGLAELKARVDALYESEDAQSQADAELLDALLSRLVLITAPAGVRDALRANVRKGGEG